MTSLKRTRKRRTVLVAKLENHRGVFHALRWLPLVALALLTYTLYPVAGGFDIPNVAPGDVAAVDVLAPFEFEVFKSPAELARDAEVFAATVKPIYELQIAEADSIIRVAEALFAGLDTAGTPAEIVQIAQASNVRFAVEEAEYLAESGRLGSFRRAVVTMLRRELRSGVAAEGIMEEESNVEIVTRTHDTERVMRRDSVLSLSRYVERRSRYHPDPNSSIGDEVYLKFVSALFKPTLIPNTAETEAIRDELRASIDSVKDVVMANERIIAAHEVVTAAARDRLLALRAELLKRGGGSELNVAGAAGQIFTNALILSIFWLFLLFYRRQTYEDLRRVLVLTLILAIVVVTAALNQRFVSSGPELIPVPAAAMLITVLLSGRSSLVASVVLAVLLGSQAAYGGQDAVYIALIGGVAATLSVRAIQRRSQLVVAFAVTMAGFVAVGLTVGMRVDWSLAEFGYSLIRGATNAFGSAAFVAFSLPIFESLTRVTTDLTLLELSDPNRPLLRRLATEAPGTYAHSLAMANLCEAACNAIGANGLLARVGCYYHDVGKLAKPHYFAENQIRGHNPHDRLSPTASAEIIREHVPLGIKLADEHKLPGVIKSFIPEHHGTQQIAYFLDRAKRTESDEEVNPELFRYPGPIPQSEETAVTMLADGVEAALRVIEDPTEEKLADAINHILSQRIESGQLREAPITLAQLNRIKQEFLRVLSGMYHSRIEYPEESGGITARWQAAEG
ncbi:MAG: HDIG domain-containing metalloprotein [Gemmatimonadales bacterium]